MEDTLISEARSKVEALLERRSHLNTYEEKVEHALALVQMHFDSENPERIDECIRLYTDDAVWESPTRRANYAGPAKIREMYLGLFGATEDFTFEQVDRWATPDQVFDDSICRFRMMREGFENAPFPLGTKVKIRLVHAFDIRDGLISREVGYETWFRDE